MTSDQRLFDNDAALALTPGDDHYRAYVGPPGRYDVISSLQFSILAGLGLRDTDAVLDFGCGSLRLGRLLIPFLRAGGYFGIEPNAWLVEDGLDHELGRSIVELKAPRFASNADYRCDVFGCRFDFIMAQSIFTHTGLNAASMLAENIRLALKPGGVATVNWMVGGADDPDIHQTPWLYPQCHTFSEATIDNIYKAAGLAHRSTQWWHPGGVRWDVLAATPEDLPPAELLGPLFQQRQR